MPVAGYKKGISDTKVPLPHTLKFRVSDAEKRMIDNDSAERSLLRSTLLRAIVRAHYMAEPVGRKKFTGPTQAVAREINSAGLQLAKVGNNLNQLTKLAHSDPSLVDRDLLQQSLTLLHTALAMNAAALEKL